MDKNEYFAAIYGQYYTNIYYFLNSRLRNTACAEDVANDVFLAAYKNLNSYDEKKSYITTWLYAIAVNQLKNYYRRNKVQEYSIDCFPEEKGTIYYDSDNLMDQKELRAVLETALGMLPERNRRIVWMKYYDEMTSVEIGERLGITPGNVRIILKRSLGIMKGALHDTVGQ